MTHRRHSDRQPRRVRRAARALLYAAALGPASVAGATEFTVVSVNAWALPPPLAPQRDARLLQLADWLGAVDADLVALQEVWRGAVPHFPVEHQRSTVARHDDGLGLGGRARRDTFTALHFTHAHGFDGLKRKGAVRARVEIDGVTTWTVSTHLQAGRCGPCATVRESQIDELIAWLEPLDGPVLLIGDLNMDASHPEDARGWQRLHDAGYVDLADQVGATDPTYPGDGRRYDRLLTRAGKRHAVRALAVTVVGYDDDPSTDAPPAFSDHRPLYARLQLQELSDSVVSSERSPEAESSGTR